MTIMGDNKEGIAKIKKKKPWWLRILLWIAGIGIGAAVLLVIAATLVVWILTPPRLTPLVEKIGSHYLNGRVEVSRVELTYWSTWPKLTVEVDSLALISHSLDSISPAERAVLPASADTLLSIAHFRGGIHMLYLLKNDLALYDVEFHSPELNLVALDSVRANYDILPPSEPMSAPAVAPPVPGISVNRFEITGGFPVRYFNAADSMDVTVTVHDSHISGSNDQEYVMSINGSGRSGIPSFPVDSLHFGMDGAVKWNPANNPLEVEFRDFTVSVEKLSVDFNARVDASDSLKIHTLYVRAPRLRVSDALDIVPESMRGELARIDTDLELDLQATLLKPYLPGAGKLPVMKIALKIPDGSLRYDKLQLNRLNCDMEAMVNGDFPDKSTLKINKFTAVARSVGFSINGTVSHPLSDPRVKGRFRGGVSLTRLPGILWRKLGFEMKGMLRGDAEFTLRKSWLTPKKFHRVLVNGELTLSDFVFNSPKEDLYAELNEAVLRLGSSSKVEVNGFRVDSLLTASLRIDTITAVTQGLRLSGRTLSAGVGAKNVSASADTSQINPIGGNISADLLSLRSDSDSIALRIRDAGVKASLRRYNSEKRAPLLSLALNAGRIRYADKYNRVTLRKAEAEMRLHPRKRRGMNPKMKARFDSIAALHPELPRDSIIAMIVRSRVRRKMPVDSVSRENIDFGVDNNIKSLLRLWQLEGTLKAARGRLLTPYFPLRNILRNFNMTFGTDSVTISDTRIKSGRSDFTLNGKLDNISRALTSRRNMPILFGFDITSDTIDINQITDAMLAGAAFGEKSAKGEVSISDSDSDDAVQASIDNAASADARAAIVVPSNIQANLTVRAKHVLYGDLWLERFRGNVDVYDGAISLNPLQASTALGSVVTRALYSAPSVDSLSFAAGVYVKRLRLHDVLTMVNGLDTIMPLLKSVQGVVDADMAVSTRLDSMLNFDFPTLDVALKLSGDSLVLLDNETFRVLSKWLMFKNKQRNMIDHMTVEMMVKDSRLSLFPFIFDMDRYRLGVSGTNDLALNLDYHVAVLKSPLPFKFGINIKGTPDNMKIRLGKARLNEKSVASTRTVTDTVRINLINEISKAFRAGIRRGRTSKLTMGGVAAERLSPGNDETLSHEDSVAFIKQGLIEAPQGFVMPADSVPAKNAAKTKKRR